MDKIAVLIPCFNEAQTIEKVVTDWKKELPEALTNNEYKGIPSVKEIEFSSLLQMLIDSIENTK